MGDGVDSDEDEDLDMDDMIEKKSSPSPIKIEEKKVSEVSYGSAGAQGEGNKLIKVKTHMSIDDFGDLTDEKAKQIGMAEISPLERHLDDLEKTM